MKNLLKLEELLLFGLALFLFGQLEYSWWLYALLFFAPDLSMVGYLWGPRIGIRVGTDRPWRCWVAGHECVSGRRT